jgi:hypothetical protein
MTLQKSHVITRKEATERRTSWLNDDNIKQSRYRPGVAQRVPGI